MNGRRRQRIKYYRYCVRKVRKVRELMHDGSKKRIILGCDIVAIENFINNQNGCANYYTTI